jgi:hypothetical protein
MNPPLCHAPNRADDFHLALEGTAAKAGAVAAMTAAAVTAAAATRANSTSRIGGLLTVRGLSDLPDGSGPARGW